MKQSSPVIGFTCGASDLCHYGHILMFKECKDFCDHLIVGVQTDPSIDRPQKNRPIQTLEERLGQVQAVRYVDETLVYSTEAELHSLLQMTLVHIRFLGADWKGKEFTGHELPMQFHFCQRDHSFSSTELRERIFNYESLLKCSRPH